MANNRMFLVHKATGTRVMLAKYFPNTGWFMKESMSDDLSKAFEKVDWGHLTKAERTDQELEKFGGFKFSPLGSDGRGEDGIGWTLEYED